MNCTTVTSKVWPRAKTPKRLHVPYNGLDERKRIFREGLTHLRRFLFEFNAQDVHIAAAFKSEPVTVDGWLTDACVLREFEHPGVQVSFCIIQPGRMLHTLRGEEKWFYAACDSWERMECNLSTIAQILASTLAAQTMLLGGDDEIWDIFGRASNPLRDIPKWSSGNLDDDEVYRQNARRHGGYTTFNEDFLHGNYCDAEGKPWGQEGYFRDLYEDLMREQQRQKQRSSTYNRSTPPPSPSAPPPTPSPAEIAAAWIAGHSEVAARDILADKLQSKAACRQVKSKLHPDRQGGSAEAFRTATGHEETLNRHHGVAKVKQVFR